ERVAVLMAPFPLNGHHNQLLHLSGRLSAVPGLAVHFASTADLNRRTRDRIPGWDPRSAVVFHDFPPTMETNSAADFSEQLPALISSSSSLRRHFADVIRRLCAEYRRVIVVYDSLMGVCVQDFASFENAEAYVFHSVSAFTMFFFMWENAGKPFDVDRDVLTDLPSLDGCFATEFFRLAEEQYRFTEYCSGRIYNTCRIIEDEFLKMLEKPEIAGDKKQWALGPFNQVYYGNDCESWRHKSLKWLDEQSEKSVILVCFGTTTSFSSVQIWELAVGLEMSGHKFIWVLREHDAKGKLFIYLFIPKNYEERIGGRGVMVTDWAPQLDILSHSSTGGFMSHCGWNSCIESISAGVPIAAWPIHSDQPRNAVLITGILKIGFAVRDWDRRKETVTSSEIANSVKRLMEEGEGKEMRRRAEKLGGDVAAAVAEGGMTRREIDSFIAHVTR
ncbi:hypothetical protein M569_14451, partial [Genlisea aurea]